LRHYGLVAVLVTRLTQTIELTRFLLLARVLRREEAASGNNDGESKVHYKKYEVHSPLFAPRQPRISEQILAAFSGNKRLVPPPPPRATRARCG
jgi:hypothetical protein